ncbi:MAG: hypothetical protein FJ038_11390, partial [Chloroflexi bacterium]|nr:hypothetical protein [Chloroflexota bacterium]
DHGGVLGVRRGRFGPFISCSRYPDCRYIHRTGPPPPAQLPFQAICPTCGEGHLATRRARRTGSLFWGCSRYPNCRFTTSSEPVGALHDADGGPVGRRNEGGICLRCGAAVELPAGDLVARRLAGGPPDPEALKSGRGRARAAGSDGQSSEAVATAKRPAPARRRTTRAAGGSGARGPVRRKSGG